MHKKTLKQKSTIEPRRKPVALHRLVRQVRICGHDVRIMESDPDGWNSNAMGRSCCIKGRILLHEGLPPTQKAGVLLHEIFHSIADLNGLKSICDDETTISVLANSVLALIRDNRGMIEDILNLSNNHLQLRPEPPQDAAAKSTHPAKDVS